MLKKALKLMIRAATVCGLAAFLIFIWYSLETDFPGEEATAVFAGTNNDADSTILFSKGKCVVIDTGEAEDGKHIREILNEYGVQKIDCMILTHPDKDHVGGAFSLLDEFPVSQVLVPYFIGEKEAYQQFQEKANRLQIPVQTLSRDRQYIFGEWDLRVFPPEKFYYDKTNDYSLAVLAKHGENHIFIAGDAQNQRLEELLQTDFPAVDIYKVAHHGRDSRAGVKMIEKLHPEYAVVTAREPEKKIKTALDAAEAQTFCTVKKDLTFVSDGKELHPRISDINE